MANLKGTLKLALTDNPLSNICEYLDNAQVVRELRQRLGKGSSWHVYLSARLALNGAAPMFGASRRHPKQLTGQN